MLFIGLVACDRLDYVQVLLTRLFKHTKTPFELVVSEDGTGETVDWCRSKGVRVIHGPNRGCGWNKNRLLRYAERFSEAGIIALVEDDTRVWEDSWEKAWIKACLKWGHINWGMLWEDGPGPKPTWDKPRFTRRIGGQCTMTLRSVFERVGYVDPRFKQYGYEHVEWSLRHGRVMHWPCEPRSAPCFNAHIGALYERTHYDQAALDYNREVMERILAEDASTYRLPWSSDAERLALESEVEAAHVQECASMSDLIASW